MRSIPSWKRWHCSDATTAHQSSSTTASILIATTDEHDDASSKKSFRRRATTPFRAVLAIGVCTLLVLCTTTLTSRKLSEKRLEARHPLSPASARRSTTASRKSTLAGRRRRRRRRLVQGEWLDSFSADRDNADVLRYLAFGSSSTWGEGLADISLSYPYKLSPVVRNAASRGAGDSYAVLAAACTQSIVGDDSVFDVITIEFTAFDDSHASLARRLRQRFPTAMIVFVQLWNPAQMIFFRQQNGTVIDLETWRRHHNGVSIHSDAFSLQLLSTAAEGGGKWSLAARENDDRDRAVEEAAGRVGAFVYRLPQPDEDIFSFPQTFRSVMSLFREGRYYRDLSAEGHDVVARGVQRIVAVHYQGEDDATDGGETTTTTSTLGTWGSGDHCNLWYSNGLYGPANQRRRTRPVEFALSRETGQHKHALEFGAGHGGSITVTNPFPGEGRMLYLTYMTVPEAADDDDDHHHRTSRRLYPRTRIRLNGKPSVIIDPVHDRVGESSQLARTSAVGMVPPGDTIVQIDPLEKSRFKYRLVGASVLGEEISGDHAIPVEFALEPEPAAAIPESTTATRSRRRRRPLLGMWW